ncbi:MAG: transposase, partial [Candidatus Pacebacteria bacterium]|nr:transposase [Candidatus Paceibacterota bacterium]
VIFLPPYSPELNPAERYFEEMRRGTANRVFEKLEDIEKVIEAEVKRWSDDTEAMKRLLGYGWIRKQVLEVG